jgi:ketosteroid isomerase-like protein
MSDPMTTVRQYTEAFNRGDAKAMTETFATPGFILDGMAPHTWYGSTAAEDWYRDVLNEGKEHGASEYSVRLGDPCHVDVTGDTAYVVAPATMTFMLKGQRITQRGASFTAALRKVAGQWRIAAWAWTKGTRAAE